jgi:hypothetical protein
LYCTLFHVAHSKLTSKFIRQSQPSLPPWKLITMQPSKYNNKKIFFTPNQSVHFQTYFLLHLPKLCLAYSTHLPEGQEGIPYLLA